MSDAINGLASSSSLVSKDVSKVDRAAEDQEFLKLVNSLIEDKLRSEEEEAVVKQESVVSEQTDTYYRDIRIQDQKRNELERPAVGISREHKHTLI